jgi:hypothetical protein
MAPSGNPVKELILQNLETVLAAIAAGDDYYTTVRKVFRLDVAPPEVNSFPAVAIVPQGTDYDNPRTRVTNANAGAFRVQLTLLLNTSSNVARTIERFIRDVHKALWVDYTRGGYAHYTRIVRDEIFYPVDESDPLCGADVFLEIDYRTSRSDLNTAT